MHSMKGLGGQMRVYGNWQHGLKLSHSSEDINRAQTSLKKWFKLGKDQEKESHISQLGGSVSSYAWIGPC